MTETRIPRTGNVLVVDDEPSARAALVDLLRDQGFTVRSAGDGVEALRRIDDWMPDVLLTDLMMPGMDGNELMRKVRERNEAIGVIVMTAHGSLEKAVAAMREGADDYLTKPLDFDELLVVVRRVLETQALRRENARLKHAAVAMRDQVLGVVAHELRNLLGPIGMRAALVRTGASLEQAQTHGAAIEDVVRRMGSLVEGLLDVASLDAGKFAVVPARCEVQALLHDTNALFGGVAAAKSIALRLRVDDPALALCCDRERVLQILANLVGNALKFTPRKGLVDVSVHARDGSVRFAVSDQGPGISPEHLPRLFDRFWKDDATRVKGTGLGLFIAKSLVDAQGGRIWLESARGGGTTFYFTLPLAPCPPDRRALAD